MTRVATRLQHGFRSRRVILEWYGLLYCRADDIPHSPYFSSKSDKHSSRHRHSATLLRLANPSSSTSMRPDRPALLPGGWKRYRLRYRLLRRGEPESWRNRADRSRAPRPGSRHPANPESEIGPDRQTRLSLRKKSQTPRFPRLPKPQPPAPPVRSLCRRYRYCPWIFLSILLNQ